MNKLLNNIRLSGFALVGFLIACQPADQHTSESEVADVKTQIVEVVNPAYRDFVGEIQITGTAMPNKIVLVHAMESGYLRVIHKDIGDKVKQGELIAELDNPELKRMSDKLVARFEAKRANYERLDESYKNTPDLTPKQMLDEAKAEYLAASAEVSAIQDRRGFLRVKAPFDGTITKRFVDQGALIQSGMNNSNASAIVELQQLDPIRLTIPLPESDASNINTDMEVVISFPELAGASYKAKISRTAGAMDFASKTMQVEVDLANPAGKIKSGMYAKVTIPLTSRDSVLSLPVTGQLIFQDELFLLVVKDNVVERIPLRKGLSNKDFFEVLNDNIDLNSQVIIQGKSLVKAGQSVEAIIKSNTE
jgi:RND family efflux transporter MFP subunit